MKNLTQSKTIWFNSILVSLPVLLGVLQLIDIDLLKSLGIKDADNVFKVILFLIGAIGLVLRMNTNSAILINSDIY